MTSSTESHHSQGERNQPLIGLSPNSFPAEDRKFYKNKPLEYGDASMATAVRRAGGLPLMLYRAGVQTDAELAAHARDMMGTVQGLLLTGGADLSPRSFGEEPVDERWKGARERDRWEIALYRAALDLGRPVLGICRRGAAHQRGRRRHALAGPRDAA